MVRAINLQVLEVGLLYQHIQHLVVVLLVLEIRGLGGLDEQVRTCDPIGHLHAQLLGANGIVVELEAPIAAEEVLIRVNNI